MNKNKFVHIKSTDTLNSLKLSADINNTTYTLGKTLTIIDGEPDIPYDSIIFIKDSHTIWTHGSFYAEGSDVFSTDELTTVSVGGIEKNTDLNNLSYSEILEKMLYTYVSPTYSSLSIKKVLDSSDTALSSIPSLFEKGLTYKISEVASTFTKGSKTVNLLEFYSDSGLTNIVKSISSPKTGTTYTLDEVVSGNNTFTIYSKLFDTENKGVTRSATLTFTNPVYSGISSTMNITGDDIVNNCSTRELKFSSVTAGKTTMEYTFNIKTSSKYYPFVAYPATWSDLTKINDGATPYTSTFTLKTVNLDVNENNKSVPYKVYVNNVGFTSLTDFKYIFYF